MSIFLVFLHEAGTVDQSVPNITGSQNKPEIVECHTLTGRAFSLFPKHHILAVGPPSVS